MAYQNIEEANKAVVQKMIGAAPFLTDVVPAHTVIPELKEHVLLHAGPPIKYENMTDPMQGSCVGAILLEGWAKDEEGARELLEHDKITFIPCHDVNALEPMGGLTSMNMPVVVVVIQYLGNEACCIIDVGIGAGLHYDDNIM